MAGVKELTESQLESIVIIERVCSSLSLIGCVFIITTFLTSKAFHKPINRLVFYASIGNAMTNVATLIARSALNDLTGFLCQFQGFLIQMFMSADAYWSLCMAINVYLTFFRKYDADGLRTMEKWYLLGCYGLSFIPAFVYIFINTGGNRMYGNATLWCWVATDYDYMRIATFYGPVWVVIAVTFGIYFRCGNEIFRKRKQLMNFKNPQPDIAMADPFSSMKTTEIHVVTESADGSPLDVSTLGRRREPEDQPQYSVSVSGVKPGETQFGGPQVPPPAYPSPTTQKMRTEGGAAAAMPSRRYNQVDAANTAAWSYTKVAVFFFIALLVTWIPSSANRVYSVVHPGFVSVPLNFASSFVLPLQGFWNAVIYAMTSWSACRGLWFAIVNHHRASRTAGSTISTAFGSSGPRGTRLNSSGRKNSFTESTTELHSRPNSNDSPV